ncbi:GlxA family transcriptional regulator [Cribrihabitans sp. XS_ASV171]
MILPRMTRVTFVLFPGFQMLAFVLASETMRIANKCAGREVLGWQVLSVTRAPVTASNGALVAPDRDDWSAAPGDLVLLCAGYEPLRSLPQGARAWLHRAERQGAMLGGVDTGSVVLARLGFLAGHEAVLHHEAEAGFRESWPEIAVSDRIYCLDERRLTAAGGTATGDAMLAWIARVASVELAEATAEAMGHGEIRPALARQRRGSDPVLARMEARMRAAMEDPVAIAALAKELGLSEKQLRLRSVRGLGRTPSQVYLGLRLKRAMGLMRDTQMPLGQVAAATGFASLAGFSRAFRRHYGAAPRDVRKAAPRGFS